MITQVLHCPYCQGTDIVRHARPWKASNATGAVRAAWGVGGRFSWSIAMLANHLRSSNRSSIWP